MDGGAPVDQGSSEASTKSEQEGVKKSKQEAIDACVDQHLALLQCFQQCRNVLGFCCLQEHTDFWECYKKERGRDETVISRWITDKLGTWGTGASNPRPQPHPQPQQQPDSGVEVQLDSDDGSD